jgi:hypothetical protein
MGLGTSFYVKLVAAIIGIGLAAFLAFLLLDRLVYRYGFIAAMVVVAGILLAIGYVTDRKQEQRDRERASE